MKRVFTSKKQRKQAEDAIIRDMKKILSDLEDHRRKNTESVDKKQVMSVLTQFVQLKKSVNVEK